MRRLPVFLVLDVSDSMVGDPIQSLEKGIDDLIKKLRQDPYALETVFVSIIAFAGKVKTLVPLIDLPMFYPPKLPLGSGTSLGKALTHLMDEIDEQVQPTTLEQKGDWQPLVYLMTDGKPTDNCMEAINQWKAKYAKRAQMIAIGLGAHVATKTLSQFADHVLSYNGEDESDFSKFIEWMTLSVRSQSIKIQDGKNPNSFQISLEKAGDVLQEAEAVVAASPGSDEDFAIFVGRCQKKKSPYLLKYERISLTATGYNSTVSESADSQFCYRMTGCFPIAEGYFDWSVPISEIEQKVNMNALMGGASCPHCGNRHALGLCSCGNIFCLDGLGTAHCPWCSEQLNMQIIDEGDDELDIVRSLG